MATAAACATAKATPRRTHRLRQRLAPPADVFGVQRVGKRDATHVAPEQFERERHGKPTLAQWLEQRVEIRDGRQQRST